MVIGLRFRLRLQEFTQLCEECTLPMLHTRGVWPLWVSFYLLPRAAAAPLPPGLPPPPQSPPGPPMIATIIDTGTCQVPIFTLDECSAAAFDLRPYSWARIFETVAVDFEYRFTSDGASYGRRT